MDLPTKLQLKPDQGLECVHAPTNVDAITSKLGPAPNVAPALLVFVTNRAALAKEIPRITKAATSDRLTWVAYPKAGQLGTDLNRDSLAATLLEHGAQPVRQVAVDEVWSALRFRPA